jgi:hypothetical protein
VNEDDEPRHNDILDLGFRISDFASAAAVPQTSIAGPDRKVTKKDETGAQFAEKFYSELAGGETMRKFAALSRIDSSTSAAPPQPGCLLRN